MSFPTEEEQRNIVEKAEQVQRSAFSMPQQIIDEVLTSGANSRDTILDICVQYSKGKSSAENTDFLKEHYGVGGKGFIFGQSKVSVWWNEDGIRISYGESAVNRGHLVSWERVDACINELLELGRYTPQEILDKTDEFERKNAAISFYEMYRDTNRGEYPELKEHFNIAWFGGSYDDTIGRITELFKKSENIEFAVSVTETMNRLYAENNNVMRFRWYAPDKVMPRLKDLQLEHRHFTANEYRVSNAGRFITEDEINKLFQRGSGYEQGKIRIYLYFQEHTDTKERIDFLKSEYGIGGYNGGLFNESHGAKGIVFSRSDIMSPLAKVTIPWNKAEKRIDSLIKSGQYLTERQLAEDIPRYQSEQEQQKIRREKYNVLHDMDRLTPEEKRATLARRISIFTDIADNSDKRIFADYGIENLLNETEIGIAEAIRNSETRQKLAACMQKISGASTDMIGRNCGNAFAEELRGLKVIDLQRIGDFYEVNGEEAVQVAEVLNIALTRRHIENSNVPMTGFPVHALEHYMQMLENSGYIVNIPQKEYDIGFGRLGNGVTVWNRFEEVDHDYKTIAHIEENGEIKYYEDLPDEVKQTIEEQAENEKADYDERVFRDTMYDIRYTELYKAVSAYAELQEQNPDSVIIAQVGNHFEVIGDYAELASELWDSYMLERTMPGNNEIFPMTGFVNVDDWGLYKDAIAEAEHDVVVASELGEDGKYKNVEHFPAENKIPEHDNIIGRNLVINDHQFIIESIDYTSGDVSMRDVTFENNVGFPINRVEKIGMVERILTEQEQTAKVEQTEKTEQAEETEKMQTEQSELIPNLKRPKSARVDNTVIYPEIPMSERHNFRITDDNLGVGGPKEKFRNNIAAIEMLKTLESEHRLATPEEQEILS